MVQKQQDDRKKCLCLRGKIFVFKFIRISLDKVIVLIQIWMDIILINLSDNLVYFFNSSLGTISLVFPSLLYVHGEYPILTNQSNSSISTDEFSDRCLIGLTLATIRARPASFDKLLIFADRVSVLRWFFNHELNYCQVGSTWTNSFRTFPLALQ